MTDQDNDIQAGQFILCVSKGLPEQAFDAITLNRLSGMSFADNQAQSCVGQVIVSCQHQQCLARYFQSRIPENGLEFIRIQQSLLF